MPLSRVRSWRGWGGRVYHAADWALEAIDALTGNLHRAHLTIESFATRIAPTPTPPNPLSVVNPVKPRRRTVG